MFLLGRIALKHKYVTNLVIVSIIDTKMGHEYSKKKCFGIKYGFFNTF